LVAAFYAAPAEITSAINNALINRGFTSISGFGISNSLRRLLRYKMFHKHSSS
jgi:lysozyme family protein